MLQFFSVLGLHPEMLNGYKYPTQGLFLVVLRGIIWDAEH